MKGVSPSLPDDAAFDEMGALLEMYDDTRRCQRGQVLEGVVASVSPKSILVDIGAKCDAFVHPHEVEQMTPEELQAFRPGQRVMVYVVDAEEQDNMILVSLSRAEELKEWTAAQRLSETGEVVTLPVVDSNRGGVIVEYGSLRGFVPGSQLASQHRLRQQSQAGDHRWSKLVGETLRVKVIEVTPQENRLIFSERATQSSRSRKQAVLEKLQPGEIYTGVVSNLVPFGAFVNVNGVDGLLHISEMAWRRIDNPAEVLAAGQRVEVYVLEVDVAQERLSLSLKRLQPDPWDVVMERYTAGQTVEVEVVNLTAFGAFALILEQPEIEGLIHISELSETLVGEVEEVVQVGDRRLARIMSIQPEEHRIAFSLKRVAEGEAETDTEA